MPLRVRFAPLLVAFMAFSSTGAAVAGAAPDATLDEARSAYDEAEREYALGHFEEALKSYERAFKAKALPAFLFNIGQCHRNLGHWDQASFFFRGYLGREPKAKNRAAVLALIDQMGTEKVAELARRAQSGTSPVVVPTPGAGTPSTGPTPPEKTEPGTTTATAPLQPPTKTVNSDQKPPIPVSDPIPRGALPPSSDTPLPVTHATPIYKRWWLWTAIGVVAVGGVAGIAAASLNPSVSAESLHGTLGPPIDAR